MSSDRYQKKSDEETVKSLASDSFANVDSMLCNLEYKLSVNNVLFPYYHFLLRNKEFQKSDLLHYQLIHGNMISLYDFEELFQLKPTVWTIHDLWLITGHYLHPFDCEGWKNGCIDCPRILDDPALRFDTAHALWNLKKKCLRNINIDFVVTTDYMRRYLKNSPISAHFSKIHKIPFGLNINNVMTYSQEYGKQALGIPKEQIVFAFRDSDNGIKGQDYILKALQNVTFSNITLLSVGGGHSLEPISDKYPIIELGWQNDQHMIDMFYTAADIFLMPSLAESFGMMSVEAMAYGCPVICFQNTVLEEITYAPECGVAVPYRDSGALEKAIGHLIVHPEERRRRGELGREIVKKHYKYSDYVRRHVELYESVLKRTNRRGKRRE